MEFKGTKGKWIVSTSKEYSGEYSLTSEQYAPTFAEDEANALLMSKSLEMLDMLKKYIFDLKNIVPKSRARDSRIYDVEQLIKEATELCEKE